MGNGRVVFVAAESIGLIVFEPDTLPFGHASGEGGSFLREPFDWSSGINAFRCIDADQPNTLARFEHDRVTVDYTLDCNELLTS